MNKTIITVQPICYFDENKACKTLTQIRQETCSIKDKIHTLIDDISITRFNNHYDTLPETSTSYIKKLMELTNIELREKRNCKLCEKKVEQIFLSVKNLYEAELLKHQMDTKSIWKLTDNKKIQYWKHRFSKEKYKTFWESNIIREWISLEKIDIIAYYINISIIECLWWELLADERMTCEKLLLIAKNFEVRDILEFWKNRLLEINIKELDNYMNWI